MAYEAGPPRARKPAEFGYIQAAGPGEDRLVRPMTIQTTIDKRRIAGNG